MRDLLFLAHRIPYPPDKGDKIRSYHILCHLASRFRIHLGCFLDDRTDERHIAQLREICAEVFCIPLRRAMKIVPGLLGAALGKSMTETIYQDRRLQVWVRNTLRIHDIKEIFVFCSAMSPYVRGLDDSRRVVIDMVDVDSEKWGAYARSARWPVSGFYRFEQRRVRALEKRAVAGCGRALFVSKTEAQTFFKLAPELCGRVGYLENGVDLNRFDPACVFRNPFEAGVSAVVFMGAMNYRPNIDAVVWFAREIFPEVRRACAGAEFWIVGANPAASVRRLSRQPGVKVTNTVEDVRPYLAHASCSVAPMRIARGVQNKVLEAMAMAKTVVLTPPALEGLSAIPGQDVLVASNAGDFARHVSDVLSSQGTAMGRAARARIERDHSWQRNLKGLDLLFGEQPPAIGAGGFAVGSRPPLAGAIP